MYGTVRTHAHTNKYERIRCVCVHNTYIKKLDMNMNIKLFCGNFNKTIRPVAFRLFFLFILRSFSHWHLFSFTFFVLFLILYLAIKKLGQQNKFIHTFKLCSRTRTSSKQKNKNKKQQQRKKSIWDTYMQLQWWLIGFWLCPEATKHDNRI